MKETVRAAEKRKAILPYLRSYWLVGLMAGVIALILYYFCRTKDSDVLLWILAPTAWWARSLGGIYFEYLPHQGYVNYFHRFLIAPSCSGSRFMLLTFLMLVFSFLPPAAGKEERRGKAAKYLWFVCSLVFAYGSTVFVNGIRIVVSVYLPNILEQRHLLDGWLTPDRLHTLIGMVLYFTSLCLIYLSVSRIHRKIFRSCRTDRVVPEKRTFTVQKYAPAFWYLLIVLGLPFVKRVYHKEWEGFGQYAALVVGGCAMISAIFVLMGKVGNRERS